MSPKELEAVVAKLQAHAERVPDFSPQEIQVVKEMMRAFSAWQALGRAAKWLIVTLGLVAGALAAWGVVAEAVKKGLRAWLG